MAEQKNAQKGTQQKTQQKVEKKVPKKAPKKVQTKEQSIINTLTNKSLLKQGVYDNTHAAFLILKEVLQEINTKYNNKLAESDQRIKLKYYENEEFEAELKVAGDLLIFTMHSNIFQFNREHEIWKTKYVKKNVLAGFSGIISVYNFLSDSFKYHRHEDMGYLIARIFINKDNYFFVQGKRQTGFNYTSMGSKTINKKALTGIVEAAIQYTLDFDLLVPPYDNVKLATVGQIRQSISDSRLRTGKRLGFQFRSDDIDN